MIKDRTIQEVINKVATDLDFDKDVATLAFKSTWDFVYNTLKELPKFHELTEEEFNELKLNFNFPSIGKLYTTWDIVSKITEKYDNKNERD